jgi:hypothetical protein
MRLLGESTFLQDHETRHTWEFITLGGSATALFGSSFLYFMWTFFFKRNIYTFIITGQKEDLYKRLAWLEYLHTSMRINQWWHYLSYHHYYHLHYHINYYLHHYSRDGYRSFEEFMGLEQTFLVVSLFCRIPLCLNTGKRRKWKEERGV